MRRYQYVRHWRHRHVRPAAPGRQQQRRLQFRPGGNHGDPCKERPCGTDVFTKAREREVAERVCDRQQDHEEDENRIFQKRQRAGDLALFELGSRDFMEQLLYESERTEEAAYHSSEKYTVQNNYSDNVVRCALT